MFDGGIWTLNCEDCKRPTPKDGTIAYMESGEKLFWGAVGAFVLYAIHQQSQPSTGLGNFAQQFMANTGQVHVPTVDARGPITQNTGLPIANINKDFPYQIPADSPAQPQQRVVNDYVDQSNGRSFAQMEADNTKFQQDQVAAGQAEYSRTHARAVYCGPGCVDFYDTDGNLTSRGQRGQSAGSLLADVAAGVSGLDGW